MNRSRQRFGALEVSVLAAIAISLGLGAAHPARAGADRPPVHDGRSAPVVAWSRAMETGDLAALARMHEPATIAFPPDEAVVTGASAIMKGYADLFAKYAVRVSIDEAHWVEQPPLIASWGRTTLTLLPKAGGAPVVSHTRFTDVAVKVGDDWRYLVDHASKPIPK